MSSFSAWLRRVSTYFSNYLREWQRLLVRREAMSTAAGLKNLCSFFSHIVWTSGLYLNLLLFDLRLTSMVLSSLLNLWLSGTISYSHFWLYVMGFPLMYFSSLIVAFYVLLSWSEISTLVNNSASWSVIDFITPDPLFFPFCLTNYYNYFYV